eukprot:TRINITY_DN11177_c0_g1_i1.p1 TRINITY_DN11177_c0_g1~~TRINITY_DN11177_c0_g1_i1.p1  ORF type:complete len:188 (+),score=56.55 TRINITY_DN11177_c0_g1_i1:44-565(+)
MGGRCSLCSQTDVGPDDTEAVVALADLRSEQVQQDLEAFRLAQRGKAREALELLRAASSAAPTSAHLRNAKGVTQFLLRNFDSARGDFEQASEREPTRGLYLYNLGATLFVLGDIEGAARRFREVLLVDPLLVHGVPMDREWRVPSAARRTSEAGLQVHDPQLCNAASVLTPT